MRSSETRRVLVTGSGRGIGKGIALEFARQGAKVQLAARTMDELEATRTELLQFASEVRATALDLLVSDSARLIVHELAEAWAGLDVLVTNAWAAGQDGFLELDDEVWPATGSANGAGGSRQRNGSCNLKLALQ